MEQMAMVVSAGMPKNKKSFIVWEFYFLFSYLSFKYYLHFLQLALSLLKK